MSPYDLTPREHPTTTKWLARLLGYDGLLPALVILIPAVLAQLPGAVGAIEITATLLPIIAFFWRLNFGLSQIRLSTCPWLITRLQIAALCVALVALLLVDSFMILSWRIPAGALGAGDYRTAFMIYLVYLVLMAFATYPGPRGSVSPRR